MVHAYIKTSCDKTKYGDQVIDRICATDALFYTADDIIDEIPEGTKYFSKIDLSKAYHEVRIVDTNNCLVIRTRSVSTNLKSYHLV